MGYFKTVSKRKRKKRKIICFIWIIMLILIILIWKKIKLNDQIINNFLFNYSGLTFLRNAPDDKVVFKDDNPFVYIYNTHQTENYQYSKNNSFNIDYNVEFASYIFKSYLEKHNINSLVEKTKMKKVLEDNNLKYKESYKGSRILLEQSIINHPSLKYFIDIHRDSSIYEKTTCEIDGIRYAKIMFIIGLNFDNYELNEELARNLNNKLISINPCLSRGILEKSGPGVDGKYNEDFNQNVIVIELGGQYNTIDEVDNTLELFAKIFASYLEEQI